MILELLLFWCCHSVVHPSPPPGGGTVTTFGGGGISRGSYTWNTLLTPNPKMAPKESKSVGHTTW